MLRALLARMDAQEAVRVVTIASVVMRTWAMTTFAEDIAEGVAHLARMTILRRTFRIYTGPCTAVLGQGMTMMTRR